MLYVALRPDRNHRLVMFPYYCKYVGSDDHNTAFRHIDISIPKYLDSGRGRNMIQGSVSLDDETTEDGCTILVPKNCFSFLNIKRVVLSGWSVHNQFYLTRN